MAHEPGYYLVLSIFALCALPAYLALGRRSAAYGRHAAADDAAGIPARWAWICMELPSAASFAIASGGPPTRWGQGALLWCLWELHYLHRGLVYPLRIRSQKRVPIWIVVSAFMFTSINGALMGTSIFGVGPELGRVALSHPRMLVGVLLFLCGMWLNVDSDTRLLRTPRGADGGYRIPRGGGFRLVSAPNYLGEIIEWVGWTIASGSSAALVFLIWTLANLVPRARAHHAWCLRELPGYPRDRRALVPRLLPALLLCAALSSSGCGAHAVVRAEIDIAAPPEVVWGVLAEVQRYPEWNPFTQQFDGVLVPGADVVLHVVMRPGKKSRLQGQHVLVVDPGARIEWQTKVGARGMLRAHRIQIVRANPDGGTHYETSDAYVGSLVPLVMSLYRRDLERGFSALVHALKVRAESRAPAP